MQGERDIDLAALNEMKTIMKGRFGQMIEFYLGGAESYIEEIKDAVDNNDLRAMSEAVAALLSSSNQVGALKIVSICRELQRELASVDEDVAVTEQMALLYGELVVGFDIIKPQYNQLLSR